jgi:diacylglycerol kinase (ATP)
MKLVKLLYNPGAGDGEHTGDALASIIESAGFMCSYESTKEIKGNAVRTDHIDLIALAGGDGTIRKIAKQLLEEDVPIGLLPTGTANNIAKTLSIPTDPGTIVRGWQKQNIKHFDIGLIRGLDEETFFLEGFGFGVFPLLMDAMRNEDKKSDEPQKKIKTAVELLIDIVSIASPTRCEITVDGSNYSGKFLLAEVMNIRSIGPNLNLSPFADPGDGKFEVVLITEEQREDFVEYLSSKNNGEEKRITFNIVQGKRIAIQWEGTSLHIDDEKKIIEEPVQLDISIQPGAFKFLVP